MPPLRSFRKGLVLGGCLLLLALFGWVDYLAGHEIGSFVFQAAPVGLAAWHLGRWPGVVAARLAAE